MFLSLLIDSVCNIEILSLNFRALRLSISMIAQKQFEEHIPLWMYFISAFLIKLPFSQWHIDSEAERESVRCGRDS